MPDTRPPLLGSTPFRGLLILFAIISLLVLDYFVLKNSREQARARAEENLQTTAFALAQHVERTIEQADEMGRVIREQFVRGENYSTFLQLYKRVESKLYVQFAFIDAQGITRFSTVPGWKPIDLSDRKHFRVHADGDGLDWYRI